MEARIVRVIMERYPITLEEIRRGLHLSQRRLMLHVNRLRRMGIVLLEPLPDRTFIRLIRADISFIGRRSDQKRPIKRKTGPPPREYEGYMHV